MAYAGPASADGKGLGARRKKLTDVLKAANDFRQSYFQGGDAHPWGKDDHGHDYDGTFPDAAVVRSGNEEMILFPSYAKYHSQRTQEGEQSEQANENDADYWQRQWARHEESKGVVVVDVRGWIYTPQRGPATRRQRLMIGLARQLSGIAAPPAGKSTNSSQISSRAASPDRVSRQDEDLIAMEAEQIIQRGKIEAEFAGRGVLSEQSGRLSAHNRSQSSDALRQSAHRLASYSSDDSGTITPLQKRDSWAQPAKMSTAELVIANRHLLHRLRPFMANPLVESPVKAFFYNETTAREKTVFTNPSGHFTCRATLDFVPTHVRILAGDELSATERVCITPERGVSLISDIDDTIKHSAISAGPREIFRNAFIRDLGDLKIEGVRDWYQRLNDKGVKFHYVSNSPWQMYPILTTFFKTAGLPAGSFHLKQYSGMLQGIFEPVAERKRSSLDQIMRDFPDRKYILVGDSGEADLEVYTEVVLDNPGRILAIFIRDVTSTPPKSGYFDSSTGSPGHRSRQSSRSNTSESLSMSKRLSRPNDIQNDDVDLQAALAASLADMEGETRRATRAIHADSMDRLDGRPVLPPRAPSVPFARAYITASPDEDLIDLSDDVQSPGPWVSSDPWGLQAKARRVEAVRDRVKSTSSPPPPKKPAALRGLPQNGTKPPPPMPRKPSSAVRSAESDAPEVRPSPLSQVQRQDSIKVPPPLPARRNYREKAKEKIGSVLPSSTTLPGRQRPVAARAVTTSRIDAPRPLTAISPNLGGQGHPDLTMIPDIAPTMQRRAGSSTSLASLRKAANRMSSGYSDDGLPGDPSDPGLSKKEYLWVQRLAKARAILDRQGVVLRTWRVGSDAQETCVRLVDMAQKDFDRDR